MSTAEKLYLITELINKKAGRKKLREAICLALDCSLQTFYLKSRATTASKYRWVDEEEKIIAEKLGVSRDEILNQILQPA